MVWLWFSHALFLISFPLGQRRLIHKPPLVPHCAISITTASMLRGKDNLIDKMHHDRVSTSGCTCHLTTRPKMNSHWSGLAVPWSWGYNTCVTHEYIVHVTNCPKILLKRAPKSKWHPRYLNDKSITITVLPSGDLVLAFERPSCNIVTVVLLLDVKGHNWLTKTLFAWWNSGGLEYLSPLLSFSDCEASPLWARNRYIQEKVHCDCGQYGMLHLA
jgi:hypothetical protein